jgi:hypothetical protein
MHGVVEWKSVGNVKWWKKIRSVRSKDEKLKNISICELFYKVAMDIIGPFLKHKEETNIY